MTHVAYVDALMCFRTKLQTESEPANRTAQSSQYGKLFRVRMALHCSSETTVRCAGSVSCCASTCRDVFVATTLVRIINQRFALHSVCFSVSGLVTAVTKFLLLFFLFAPLSGGVIVVNVRGKVRRVRSGVFFLFSFESEKNIFDLQLKSRSILC